MSTVEETRPAGDESVSTARVEAFSDGIIAIAATLLVIELAVPEQGADVTEHLRHELPAIAAYVVSFGTILIYWVNHHALFTQVRTADRGLLFLNGLLLLLISFISYPTAVLGRALQEGGDAARAAAVFYTSVLTLSSVSFLALWLYLHRRKHLLEESGRGISRAAVRRGVLGSVTYAVTIAVSAVNGAVALGLVALLALYWALPPLSRRRTS